MIERGLNPRQPIITTQVSTLYSEFLTKYYTYSFGIEFPLMFLIAFMKISMFQVLQTNQFCPTHSREEIITKLEKQDLRKCGFKFPALCVLKDLPFTPRIRYSIIFLFFYVGKFSTSLLSLGNSLNVTTKRISESLNSQHRYFLS